MERNLRKTRTGKVISNKMDKTIVVKNGKVGLAKSTYDAFCSEYEQLLGTPYNKSFNDICH